MLWTIGHSFFAATRALSESINSPPNEDLIAAASSLTFLDFSFAARLPVKSFPSSYPKTGPSIEWGWPSFFPQNSQMPLERYSLQSPTLRTPLETTSTPFLLTSFQTSAPRPLG